MNLCRLIRENFFGILQVIGAIIITLVYQFIIPLSWFPLDNFMRPSVEHGDLGTNIIIFTISQWYFSFSVVWFFKRDNKFINNFLIYSIPPLYSMLILEFFGFGLYYDYIHLIPLIVAFVIIFTQLETLKPKFVTINIIVSCIWIYLAYFWRVAYYDDSINFLTFKLVIICIVDLIIAFIIAKLQKKVYLKEIT
ncbi:MAG: hypothetical protein EU533_06645 [Promethearchaeota archaeon]|nr:MAG: hypothetical protein EU533_06645 [Candidatus Lokiarchaeota archaeon]